MVNVSNKRHRNPDGSEGGEVWSSAHVDPTVYLGYSCIVQSYARVYGNVRIEGGVIVDSFAIIDGREGDVIIRGRVRVWDNAHISGFVRVISDNVTERWMWVGGHVKVCGYARLNGYGVYDSGTIEGSFEDMTLYLSETQGT
jgi:carbonic anhydrase/acetyltransferase-like protein (isoleucine patch superfamily)